MSTPRVRLTDLLLLIVAVIAMLLSAPSLQAKTTHSRTKKTTHKKKTTRTKTHTKKVRISFDGSATTTSHEGSELGDEIPAPRIADRDLGTGSSNIKLRGNSMDKIWSQRAEPSADYLIVDENPDLAESDVPASKRSKHAKEFVAANSSLDESSLAKFKRSKRAAPATRKPVVVAASVPAKTPARPVTRTYVRNSTPLVSANHLSTSVAPRGPSEFDFNFAFESTVTLGRKYQLETLGERNYEMKNEVFVGANHSSGWGAKLSASFVSTSNDDNKKDESRAGDPSIIVAHPSLYKTPNLAVYGRARYYLPVSSPSRASGVQHFAYYLLTDVQLPEQLIVSNAFIPQYFHQSKYKSSDAFALIYDATELTRKFDWFRLGLGQQTQIESHEASRPGTTVEAYPFFDYIGIPNALLEAKLYIPLYVDGPVGGGPLGTSIANIQAEFFAKLSF